jgi:hypothetical protein
MLFNSYFSLLLAGWLHPESAKAWVLSLRFSTGNRSRTGNRKTTSLLHITLKKKGIVRRSVCLYQLKGGLIDKPEELSKLSSLSKVFIFTSFQNAKH